jgi:eukaryotic-like serine/threonine-protein kinase
LIAGRYTRGREIGRGGMGAVWLGRDDVLGRDVALKRIGMVPGALAPDLERAEREARLAARLNHPHVVAVYDLVDDGDDHWLVMEYVEGVTLGALIKRDGALSPDEAAGLVRQAADALTAAHAVGIVHRDVKPSNMLVTPTGEVKLSDFGIARAEADASLTQTGLVTGSPAYLAPEVASGATATEASDVWSLGASLFHALSGQPPYDTSENLMGALYRIVHEDPPRLADAGWLAPVLEHTMTREPEQRWSMAQVRDFLDQGRDVAVHPEPLAAVDPQTTQVLDATPAQPLAVPPIVADPALVVPPAPALAPTPVDETRRRRRPVWPWVAAVVALVAVVVIAFAALTSGNGGDKKNTGAGGPTSSGPAGPSSSSSATTGAPQAAAMRTFISNYFATVTSDDHATFDMLTPAFQAQSKGYAGYHGFWKTIASATPSNIVADPAALTVSYDIAYVKVDGSHSTDHRTLQLVRSGTSYLIDGES